MGADRSVQKKSLWVTVVDQLNSYVRQQGGKVGISFMDHPGKGKTYTPENIEHLLRIWTDESVGFRFDGAIKCVIKDKVINSQVCLHDNRLIE